MAKHLHNLNESEMGEEAGDAHTVRCEEHNTAKNVTKKEIGSDIPSNRILHSRLNFFESSSICLSIASERAFPSRSSGFDTQLPMYQARYTLG